MSNLISSIISFAIRGFGRINRLFLITANIVAVSSQRSGKQRVTFNRHSERLLQQQMKKINGVNIMVTHNKWNAISKYL